MWNSDCVIKIPNCKPMWLSLTGEVNYMQMKLITLFSDNVTNMLGASMIYLFYEKLFTYLCFTFLLCCLVCLNYIWFSVVRVVHCNRLWNFLYETEQCFYLVTKRRKPHVLLCMSTNISWFHKFTRYHKRTYSFLTKNLIFLVLAER